MDERRDKNRIRFAEQRSDDRNEDAPASKGAGQRGSFGAWLRAQREARGITIDAIAEASKISKRYLDALESDRFEALPAPVFVRGFLREYARIVGLDSDEVSNFYLHARPSTRERPASVSSRPPEAPRAASRRGSLVGYGVLLAVLLAIFLGIAAAITWWASRRSQASTSHGGAAPPAASVSTTRAPSGQVARTAPLSSPALAPDSAPTPTPTEFAEGKMHVELEFLQDCWVDVVIDGRRRESELKAGGESLVLEAEEYVLLTLGNAPAVRVEVDGEPYPLTRAGSRVVRDLRIDRDTAARQNAASAVAPPR